MPKDNKTGFVRRISALFFSAKNTESSEDNLLEQEQDNGLTPQQLADHFTNSLASIENNNRYFIEHCNDLHKGFLLAKDKCKSEDLLALVKIFTKIYDTLKQAYRYAPGNDAIDNRTQNIKIALVRLASNIASNGIEKNRINDAKNSLSILQSDLQMITLPRRTVKASNNFAQQLKELEDKFGTTEEFKQIKSAFADLTKDKSFYEKRSSWNELQNIIHKLENMLSNDNSRNLKGGVSFPKDAELVEKYHHSTGEKFNSTEEHPSKPKSSFKL